MRSTHSGHRAPGLAAPDFVGEPAVVQVGEQIGAPVVALGRAVFAGLVGEQEGGGGGLHQFVELLCVALASAGFFLGLASFFPRLGISPSVRPVQEPRVCRPSCAAQGFDDSFREGRCGHCAAVFHVCRRCDRGQQYCKRGVERGGRRAKADHRARKKVTYQGIEEVDAAGSLGVRADRTAAMVAGVAISTVSAPDAETTPILQAVVGGDPPLPDVRGQRLAEGGVAAAWSSTPPRRRSVGGASTAVAAASPVSVALCADAEETSSALGLSDGFGIGRETLHHKVEVFDPRRHRGRLGSFHDLRQVSLRASR